MTRLVVWVAALGVSALGASAAIAQSMTLTSPDIKEGATIANEQVFKGFGCTGGNLSPALSWSGAPSGTKSLALSVYDPDADRQRLLALGRVQHSGGYDSVAQRCRRCEEEADAQGRNPEQNRLRHGWLWRPVSAARRQAAPLPDHGVCGRCRQTAGCQGLQRFGRVGPLRSALSYPGESNIHWSYGR